MNDSHVVGVDFETYFCSKEKYSIKSMGTYPYLTDERFDPYLISVCDDTDCWAGHPRDFNWDALEGKFLLSHNAGFDRRVHREMVKRGLAPAIKWEAWHCSADMSAFLCNRRALADACLFLLSLQVDKGMRDYADGKTVEQMKQDGQWENMLKYARLDAYHCRQLFVKHGHRWPEHERLLSDLTLRQGMRGIQVDRERLDSYIVVAHEMLKKAESILPWIAEGRPPTSSKAIAEHCRLCGIPGPPVKKTEGEDAFIEWESIYGKKHQWIAHVSNWRSINKFLESLYTVKERLQPGDIFDFGLKYAGAHTLRWSGAEGFNMQNMKKVPLFRDANGFLISDVAFLQQISDAYGVAEKTGQPVQLPDYVTYVLDIRMIFIARKGKKMISSDLSQIEPRVLAWCAGDQNMLDLLATGQSPYQAHAVSTMGWSAERDLKKENKELYALAKARILGLGYQCGWQKFITVAWDMAGLDITKSDPEFVQAVSRDGDPLFDKDGNPKMVSGYGANSKKIVIEYRAQNPLNLALWKALDDAYKGSVGQDFEMGLPSGRSMIYRDVRETWVLKKNPDTGKNERKRAVTAEVVKQGRLQRLPLYGGLLTENLVQATARDVFAEHLLTLEQTPGVEILFTCHDEAVLEVDESVTAEGVQKIMSKTPDWLAGCPITAEAKVIPCYCK